MYGDSKYFEKPPELPHNHTNDLKTNNKKFIKKKDWTHEKPINEQNGGIFITLFISITMLPWD